MYHYLSRKHLHSTLTQALPPLKSSTLSALFVCLIFVLIKFSYFHVNSALWAEDGPIFLNQAHELGLSSIWAPYAGYLHLYPRVIAFVSSTFDMQHTPIIFFGGWIIAYISMVYIICTKVEALDLINIKPTITALLLVAHPHSGEVFFTLTNAQWFTGAALAIYILIPTTNPPSLLGYVAILVTSLTGPFSLLLVPVILIQIKLYKDWSQRKKIYSIIIIAALIQTVFIFLSNRINHSGIDTNMVHWLKAAYTFFIFGKKPLIPQLASFIFWCITFYALATHLFKKINRDYESLELIAAMLMLTAGIFLMAGLITTRPEIVSPLGDGARYFFIPYVLIILASLIITAAQKKTINLIYATLSIISISAFSLAKPINLQFQSFAAFSKVKNDVLTPIRPEAQWNINLPLQKTGQKKFKLILLPATSIKEQREINNQPDQKPDTYVLFNIENLCLNTKHVGVAIDMSLVTEA